MRWAIRNDGGVSENSLGMPWGVNPNDKTVMINPPGAYIGGLMKTFHRLLSHHKVTKKNDEPKLILLHVTYFSSVPVVANVNSYDKTMELLCDTWRHEKQLVYT